ncbi:MAG: hypothetical protein ACFCBW_09550 [Candidatus Competibacterales bacterium]
MTSPRDGRVAVAAKTPWHRWLAQILELLLTPVDIDVQTEWELLSEPPRADILLLRRRGRPWTPEQRERLADGLRDTAAEHLLLEFKYTESMDLDTLQQTLAYDYFYRTRQALVRGQLASFVVSAKTPVAGWQQRYHYAPTALAGVYRGLNPYNEPLRVILLNELAPTAHNAWFKCFASRRRQVRLALELMRDSPLLQQSAALRKILAALLRRLMMNPNDVIDDEEITAEDYRQLSEEFLHFVLETTPELVTPALGAQNLDKLTPEQRLAGLDPEQRLAGLDPTTIREYLKALEKKS